MPSTAQRPKTGFAGLIAIAMLLLCALPAGVRADVRETRAELTRVRLDIERELRARPEMKEAKQEWINRRGEYNELRRAVVETLLQDSRHLSLRAEMWGLQDELDALREQSRNGIAPAGEINRLSLDIMDLGAYLSVLERRTLEQHHAALQAREAYLAAGRKLMELHRGIAEAVHQDPRFRSAHRSVMSALDSSHGVP
jgi:hypothetical protein